MSTSSMIALQYEDGRIEGAYCNWNGWPENNGRVLVAHYDTFEKIETLLDFGAISVLGSEIGEKHDFDTHDANSAWCLFYQRDRGMYGLPTKWFDTLDDFVLHNHTRDVLYLFTNGEWIACWYNRNWERTEWRRLTDVLAEIDANKEV